ncbi:MAG: hypothetical protein ACLFPU_06010 [Dehalococcoidia bacterium]
MKVGSSERRHLENYLGLKGWVWGGRYRLERYLYTLHRISGLALMFYFLLHIAMNGFRLAGGESWTSLMNIFDTPIVKFGEYLVLAGFTFHALNGLRLTLQEPGYTLGRPKPPVYPYVDALERRRPIVFAVGGVIVILLVVFIFDFI